MLLVVALVAATIVAVVVTGGDESGDDVVAVSGPSSTATTAEGTTTEVTSRTDVPNAVAVNPELQPGPTKAVGEVVLEPSDVAAGTCVNDTMAQDPTADQVGIVTVADCAAPHDAEIFSVSALPYGPDAAFPGEGAVSREAGTQCEATFDGYVGTTYLESVLDYGYYFPNEATWSKYDDRTVVCYLIDPDLAPLTGSMRGSGT